MSTKQNEEIEEMKEETIHYDLEQTVREARRESGMSIESIAKIMVEVFDRDEIELFVKKLEDYAASQSAVQKGSSER